MISFVCAYNIIQVYVALFIWTDSTRVQPKYLIMSDFEIIIEKWLRHVKVVRVATIYFVAF